MTSNAELLWVATDFFVNRLFAKGKLSVQSSVGANDEADRDIFRDVVRFLAGATPDQTEAIITATVETHDEHRVFADWLVGIAFEDTFDRRVFDDIQWRFSPGWRKRYRDVPRAGKEPAPTPSPKARLEKTGSTSYAVKNGPSWFKSGISTFA
jgi:hypothetical protein